MNKVFKILKKIRVLIALAIFFAISAQFLDIYHSLPKPYYMYNPTATLYAPSLSKMLALGSIAAGSAFIAFTICALLFGRIYCSFFCPFGILMDIIRRIGLAPAKISALKKTRLGKFCAKNFERQKYAQARNVLRYSFLGLAILAIAFGYKHLLGFIDPYPLYGKIMGCIVTPLLAESVNGIGLALSNIGIYSVQPVDGNPAVALYAFGFALFILAAISIATLLRGRLYCNTICPVGAFLGLFARFSIFKIAFDKSKCVSCGICERNCKAECIESKNKNVDFSKCVMCLNCAAQCPKSAIYLRLNPELKKLFSNGEEKASKNQALAISAGNNGKKSLPGRGISRRALPAAILGLGAILCSAAKKDAGVGMRMGMGKGKNRNAGAGIGGNCKIDEDASPYMLEGERPDKRLASPPGSGSIESFLNLCTGCQICTAACKSQILKPSLTEWGLSGFMQPFMDFSQGFCLHTCHACTKACPTGAIKFLTSKEKLRVKIGTAKFKKSLCVVKTDGTDCAACAEHCPVQAIEMIPFGKLENSLYIPHVHEDVCIGCGACEYICPVTPHKAIVVQGIKVHKKAVVFDESMRIYKHHEKKKSAPAAVKPSGDNPFPF